MSDRSVALELTSNWVIKFMAQYPSFVRQWLNGIVDALFISGDASVGFETTLYYPPKVVRLCLLKVIVDDRGNGGKTLQGTSGSLSSSIVLAIEVAPVNDPPTLVIPTADTSFSPLVAEEDRLGIVGAAYSGWPEGNILGMTTISVSSVELTDDDLTYEADGTTLQRSYSRWAQVGRDGLESATSTSRPMIDTMTVNISVSHGGLILDHARSEVTFEDTSAATNGTYPEYAAQLQLSGPMWAMADALKGMRYRTELNWNSWLEFGGSQLQPVVPEVSKPIVGPSSVCFWRIVALKIHDIDDFACSPISIQ